MKISSDWDIKLVPFLVCVAMALVNVPFVIYGSISIVNAAAIGFCLAFAFVIAVD